MTQHRLVNLSILSIEKEITADIDLTPGVREFAKQKLEELNLKISLLLLAYA